MRVNGHPNQEDTFTRQAIRKCQGKKNDWEVWVGHGLNRGKYYNFYVGNLSFKYEDNPLR